MAERNYQFRERMLEVHRPGRRMDWAQKKEGQIEITPEWTIIVPAGCDPVVYNAARDLEDYFAVSMGVCVGFFIGGDAGAKSIVYAVDGSLESGSYRLEVTGERVLLCGSDGRAAAQAGYIALR